MRSLLRDALVLVAVVLTAPLWILVRLESWLSSGDGIFTGCSELLSLFPGKPGAFLRRGFYLMTLEFFGPDCYIGFGTTLAHTRTRIGRGVYIGNRGSIGQVIIEDDVTIGCNVDLIAGRHQHFFSDLDTPIQQQGGVFQQIRIGRNCWIGNSSVIMADVGDDCVIGAGSVVVQPIPPRCVAVGNPATVKKRRGGSPGQRHADQPDDQALAPATRGRPYESRQP